MNASRKDLARAIAELMRSDRTVQDLAPALAQYLMEQRRVRELDSIMRDVQTIRAHEHGIVEAGVITAEPLTDALAKQARELIAQYTGQPAAVITDSIVDPSVIGGVKVTTAEYELNATVLAKLTTLRNVSSLKGSF